MSKKYYKVIYDPYNKSHDAKKQGKVYADAPKNTHVIVLDKKGLDSVPPSQKKDKKDEGKISMKDMIDELHESNEDHTTAVINKVTSDPKNPEVYINGYGVLRFSSIERELLVNLTHAIKLLKDKDYKGIVSIISSKVTMMLAKSLVEIDAQLNPKETHEGKISMKDIVNEVIGESEY